MKITIKHIAYAAIVVLVAALVFQSYRLSVKSNKLKAVNSELAILDFKLGQKQDSINIFESQAIILKDRFDSLGTVVKKLQIEKQVLYNKLDSALSAIDSIPPDDNYAFLQDSAYVYSGDLKYPFNGKQVTEIRKDFVENNALHKININLESAISILNKQLSTQDSLVKNQTSQIKVYSSMVNGLRDEIKIKDSDNAKLNKDVIKQKRLKYLFEGTSVAAGILALIGLL